MRRCFHKITACVAVWLCIGQSNILIANPQATDSQLKIEVLEGQGAINNIRQRTSPDMVVRVDDASQQPVAGASVAFTLPADGPSGTFIDGGKTMVVTTDATGKAVVRGMKPNKLAGKMEIRVTASHQGKTASAVITRFNMTVDNAQKSGGNGKWIAILLAVGAAGATGAVLGTRGGSTPAPIPGPSTPVPIGITAGSGSVGPPQ
jgi:hypothetical protein